MTNDTWTEWSKHVLKELERLNTNHETIRSKIEEVQQSIIEIKGSLDEVDKLEQWKSQMDEVATPTQMKELKNSVIELEKFKIRAVTVFVVLQTIFGIIIAILGLS